MGDSVKIKLMFWKLWVIGIGNTAISGVFGYFLYQFFRGESGFWLAVVWGILFLTGFLLQSLYVLSEKIELVMLAAEGVALITLFLTQWNLALLIGLVAALGFFWLAARDGQRDVESQMKFSLRRFQQLTASKTLTAISLLVTVGYFSAAGVTAESLFSSKNFAAMLKPAEPLLRNTLIRNFSFTMTVGAFLEAIALQELGEEIRNLPAAVQNQALRGLIQSAQNQLTASLGIRFDAKDTLADIFYRYTLGWVNKIPENYRLLVPLGIGVALFLTVRGIANVAKPVVFVLGYGLHRLALRTGLVVIKKEMREKEVISLAA